MNVSAMYSTIRQLASEGQSGWMPPNEVERALNLGSTDKYNEERRAFERTGHISDNLRNFKTHSDISVTAGNAPVPATYGYRTGLAVTSTKKDIDIVPDSEWLSRINDPIDPPTEARGIGSIRGSNIEVLPLTLTSVTLYFLRRPVDIVIAFSEDGNGDITINQGASTDCDWPEECHDDIILRALSYLGIPLSDELMIKLKTIKKQTEGV